MKAIADYYHHIDNGGVRLSIIDKGVKDGIVLSISAEYHGYPAVKSEMRIDNLGSEWLKNVGLMFITAANEVSKIDFEERYNLVEE